MAHTRGTRVGRKRAVVRVMTDSQWTFHTVNSIAKLMDLSPSTYLRQILNEMVEGERLLCNEFKDKHGRVEKRFYALPEKMYTQLELALYYGDDEVVTNARY